MEVTKVKGFWKKEYGGYRWFDRDPEGDRSCSEVACKCGEKILCEAYTNTCDCGVDYGMDGGKLAPRSQWGEETGENYIDVLAVGRGEDW